MKNDLKLFLPRRLKPLSMALVTVSATILVIWAFEYAQNARFNIILHMCSLIRAFAIY